MWAQPLNPLGSLPVSASVGAIPLFTLLVLMGYLRWSALRAAGCALVLTFLWALLLWQMPAPLALESLGFGVVYAIWPVLWIVFTALWLYHVAVESGSFELLRSWMVQQASGDRSIQVLLVTFCFGALLESCAGFGVPVAVTAFLLAGLGFPKSKAVVLSLVANTSPVGFGGMGLPILTLAGVTGLNSSTLSAMVGRQLPFLSVLLPFYLVLLADGKAGLKRGWRPTLATGLSYGLVQFLVSNFWGPYAADILAACFSIAVLVAFLRMQDRRKRRREALAEFTKLRGTPRSATQLSNMQVIRAWLPWLLLSFVMVLWSVCELFPRGQRVLPIPQLHGGVLITLYGKPYQALYNFQPLSVGTALLVSVMLTCLCLRLPPQLARKAAMKSWRQFGIPALTVIMIIALAYLYNYSGMIYTLGAAVARVGGLFPFASAYLGWLGCFLSGSDAASNILFGNLQVAAAHQLSLNPVLLAATNSSGGVAGKMISPQNIAVGVTTVGLIGKEGMVLRSIFAHSLLLITVLGALVYLQAYWLPSMIP